MWNVTEWVYDGNGKYTMKNQRFSGAYAHEQALRAMRRLNERGAVIVAMLKEREMPR